jgi:hypothetical protein
MLPVTPPDYVGIAIFKVDTLPRTTACLSKLPCFYLGSKSRATTPKVEKENFLHAHLHGQEVTDGLFPIA